ncbi:oxidoreductase domain-containing protein [Caballeronia arationis]|jgi:phthalate 4,5-cis-dihydrodiol dehydrogenase|uniref:4,5-dihydroxyphthalate dehydrogenase n=1 Tax=Caballeronia arationis TaxID=1777142 RepID=A0A7Z7N2L8_9BURK|nr:Gfo/Idh/MocA family oxidoreductase [Caballeronia arationis]SAK85718.1 oxidoreductase domain-containing protein [Caballeronia arationis]SOE66626.1 4,5-dihydroxyphthalate dehydrogenase [Caballeronia arationis]
MERLRLGVAGLGRAFSLMLPTFLADTRVQLAGACDPRGEACAQFEADFDAPAFDDIEQLARMPDIDAIYIASPHQFHAAHTRIAAKHGKHVLVEKPMALSLAECDDMIAACRDASVHLIVGHCHSFDTPYLRTRELIASGAFGDVKMIQALNYTDYLFRPRRPEELSTAEGGGAVFSQAAHQVDIVRLLAGSRATRIRAAVGKWDPARPTEGAYTATLWFEDGAFATLSYNGYAHFDSDEWTDWTGEMGQPKNPDDYGSARRKLSTVASTAEEARLKAAGTYGGKAYAAPSRDRADVRQHQHFGPLIVSCERGDLRPLPDSIVVYGDERRERIALDAPAVPRREVIDELVAAVHGNAAPLHDGAWARGTLEICLAMLRSSDEQRDVLIGSD